MTTVEQSAPATPASRWHPRRWFETVRRLPFSFGLIAVVLFLGATTGALWDPLRHRHWFHLVAYGVPAFDAGHWWTLITGMFWAAHPAMYVWFLILVPFSLIRLELRRGSGVAAGYFIFGQLAAVLTSSLFLSIFSDLGWEWADNLATTVTVGMMPGLFAALTATINSLPDPWRSRGRMILIYVAAIGVLFLGILPALLNAAAIIIVLAMGTRRRKRAPSIHERRFTTFVTILGLGAIQLILTVVRTHGPFGDTSLLEGSWGHAVINALIILVLANGLRTGRRLAWVLALGLSLINILAGLSFFLIVQTSIPELEEIRAYASSTNVTIADGVLWLIFFIYLLVAHGAFTVPFRRRLPGGGGGNERSVREVLRESGGGTLSWMTTWPGNRHYFSPTGRGFVTYQVHAKTAIALSDPIGPAAERTETARQFIASAEKAGFVPCFFVASEALRTESLPTWRSLQVAEDTIIDLPGLAFTGKRWNSVRTSLNKADREGVTFRLTHLSAEPRKVQQQVRQISEAWLGDKGLPEMGFTLGGVDEALDPSVRLALAYNAEGEIDGFLSWLPVYGENGTVHGWTLDLMRRREGGFGPVMEYLIGRSAQEFSAEGAMIASLSGAPLAHLGQRGGNIIDNLLSGLGEAIEPLYGFRSLHAFKRKFNPRYEPVYLLYRDEGDLARIGLGLGRAFLPDATLPSLVRSLRAPK
ncbi:bifunctional lysylphosphatidylglycerol flippase/synthetase MprF [Mycetocola sp. JXN-3]|uniref:bifunctional lysylphosphatidylglycerol flippase/synthetase MprF n=1 Tax=Mycetocola sp. JXN-3 TaxID=2116510 RepID=UPI00165D04FA|nr:DUF2156 domain-containing protein [Mycetocola sp. JXN-3]